MSVSLFEDLTINLISNSQIYKDVPYEMILTGIPLHLFFDQGSFQKTTFSLDTEMLSTIDIKSYASLRKYDRYLLIEYDPDILFSMYYTEQ